MHTVRNRLASRPPAGVPFAPAPKTPNHAATPHELALIRRGSMAVPLAVSDETGLIEARPLRRRNAKGKKARKAAARLAAAREAQAMVPAPGNPPEPPRSGKKAVKPRKPKTPPLSQPAAPTGKAVQPQQLPAIPSPPLLQQRLAAAPVLLLPHLPEPLVEPAPPRELPVARRPDPVEPVPSVLPAASKPEPALANVPLADVPLERSRALVPARRQGLVDVIAFLLRDSGRRLARWSARRHKSREEREALRRAQARQINLQRELEALDALRRAKG